MQVNFDGLSKQKNKSEEIHLKKHDKGSGLAKMSDYFSL